MATVQLLRVYYCKFIFCLGGKILRNDRFVQFKLLLLPVVHLTFLHELQPLIWQQRELVMWSVP